MVYKAGNLAWNIGAFIGQPCTLGLLQHHLLPNLVIFATISQTVIPVSGSRVVSNEIVPRTDRLGDFGTSMSLRPIW